MCIIKMALIYLLASVINNLLIGRFPLNGRKYTCVSNILIFKRGHNYTNVLPT